VLETAFKKRLLEVASIWNTTNSGTPTPLVHRQFHDGARIRALLVCMDAVVAAALYIVADDI
jgi:hypothetical protein